MPEYRRFIAYFYEYIDGKRKRNAGFVKAEQRNGVWRLQVQLRSESWPGESLPIFGFSREKERYPTVWLGKGYPGNDSMIQALQINTNDLNINFENITGMWIPCGENRCFLSNWEDDEVETDRLRLPEENMTASQEPVTEPEEAVLVEAMECEETLESGPPEIQTGVSSEQKSADSKDEGEEIREEEEIQRRQEMENTWRILLARCQRFRPFAEEEFAECIRICPRDILWLRQRQWPVGRNSFLMQGFCQYRHLMLARKTDGTYVLGVPGRMMPENQRIAASFGFALFKAVNTGLICPEGFGYWCREILWN